MKRILCAGAAIVLAGCGPKEETTIVETPVKENVTVINPTATPSPTPTSKTVIVKKPVPVNKTVVVENRKNIVVEKVAPTPTPAATPTLPVPVAKNVKPKTVPPTPAPKSKATPTATPKAAKPKAPRVAAVPPAPKATPTKPLPTPAAPKASPSAGLSVRAEVISTSKVPDPSTVAYSQSLVFTKYRIVSVEKGSYAPKEILVAQWGMKGKKLTPAARLRAGDQRTLELVPLASRPELEKVMRNDDTSEYELEPYFAIREN
ncbi:MAG TPA: hypothetical protein VF681_07505 [Abditibacteriaceae bacterium]|jgi:hypothetical protein